MSTKLQAIIVIMIMVFVGGSVLSGCGDSAARSEMNNFLQSLEKKINDLEESVKNNNGGKIAEIEKIIDNMKNAWTIKRDDLGDELTPQDMNKLVKKYNQIVARLDEIENKKNK